MAIFTSTDLILAAFTGMSLLCALEMFLLTFLTFQRKQGIYFWSLISANTGMLTVTICNGIYFLATPPKSWAAFICAEIGYVTYVASAFMVLFSRLHLLQTSKPVMKWIMAIMIIEIVGAELPLAVSLIGSSVTNNPAYGTIKDIWWRLELPCYFAVEILVSAVYIWQIRSTLAAHQSHTVKIVMSHLIWMTVVIVLVDVVVVIIGFVTDFQVAAVVQGFLLSIKLIAEIMALNQLTRLSKRIRNSREIEFANNFSQEENGQSPGNNTVYSTQELKGA